MYCAAAINMNRTEPRNLMKTRWQFTLSLEYCGIRFNQFHTLEFDKITVKACRNHYTIPFKVYIIHTFLPSGVSPISILLLSLGAKMQPLKPLTVI